MTGQALKLALLKRRDSGGPFLSKLFHDCISWILKLLLSQIYLKFTSRLTSDLMGGAGMGGKSGLTER